MMETGLIDGERLTRLPLFVVIDCLQVSMQTDLITLF